MRDFQLTTWRNLPRADRRPIPLSAFNVWFRAALYLVAAIMAVVVFGVLMTLVKTAALQCIVGLQFLNLLTLLTVVYLLVRGAGNHLNYE